MIAVPVGTDRPGARGNVLGLVSFAAAATVAGLALGLVLAGLSTLTEPIGGRQIALVVAVFGGVGYGVSEILGLRWRLPQRHWQVPQRWGGYGRPLYAAAFGAILSVGFLTFIPYAGYYLLILLAFAVTDWHWTVLFAVLFAWARVAPIVAFSMRLSVLRPSEQLARATLLSERIASVSRGLWLPRGALLLAAAVASIRALLS